MTAMFSAQDHDDLDRVLGATGGIPDPADLHALADDAVAQVRRWLAESRDHEADFAARQLAGALKEPGGRDVVPLAQLRDDRPHERALLLQRVHVAEEQVELERPGPHPADYGRSRIARSPPLAVDGGL